jgi:protein TonB
VIAAVRPPQTRWVLCFLVIAALHIGGAWIALRAHAIAETPLPPVPPAVLIDLPPMPAAPRVPRNQTPPKPKQAAPKPQPPQRVAQPVLPAAPRAPAPKIAVPLPLRAAPNSPEHTVIADRAKPGPDKPPSPTTAVPPADAAEPSAPSAAAPTVTTPPLSAPAPSTNAVPTWQGLLLGRIAHFKRYPASAQARRQQGVVYLRFSMDRHGKVVAASIDRSSGFDALDAETLALIHRAEPLPPPPPDVSGDPIELVVPVEFFLKP